MMIMMNIVTIMMNVIMNMMHALEHLEVSSAESECHVSLVFDATSSDPHMVGEPGRGP